jgi:hypothetical protein
VCGCDKAPTHKMDETIDGRQWVGGHTHMVRVPTYQFRSPFRPNFLLLVSGPQGDSRHTVGDCARR